MRKVYFLFFIFMFFISFVFSASLADSEHQEVLNCLNESSLALKDLKDFGIDSSRLKDLYGLMQNSYEAQLILFNRTGNFDFEYILTNCEKFFEIENEVYLAADMISGLESFYSDLSGEIKNKDPIEELFSEVYLEYENERYEKIEGLVDETYNLIIETKSSETALNVFYESTTRSIKNFFIKNYKQIILTVLILFLLFLIFRKIIKSFIFKLRFKSLKLRKKILLNLIKEAQDDYFDKGKLSQDVYELRLRKFSDFIRDIESQQLSIKEKILRSKSGRDIHKKERKKKKRKTIKK